MRERFARKLVFAHEQSRVCRQSEFSRKNGRQRGQSGWFHGASRAPGKICKRLYEQDIRVRQHLSGEIATKFGTFMTLRSTTKLEEAAELYGRAANAYKMAKKWSGRFRPTGRSADRWRKCGSALYMIQRLETPLNRQPIWQYVFRRSMKLLRNLLTRLRVTESQAFKVSNIIREIMTGNY